MKNIKSLLLLALTLPLGVYASRNDDNEAEMQSLIDTSSTLVQSAVGLDSVMADIWNNAPEANIPEIALEEWFSEELLNAAGPGAIDALITTLLPHSLLLEFSGIHAALGIHAAKYLGELIEDPDGTLRILIYLGSVTAGVSLGLSLDVVVPLASYFGQMPGLPYMPSLKTRLQLAVLLTAWNTAATMMAAEGDSSEEL